MNTPHTTARLAGFLYLILVVFFGGFLFSGYKETLFATLAGIPASIGELGICMWLVIFGANMPKWLPRLP